MSSVMGMAMSVGRIGSGDGDIQQSPGIDFSDPDVQALTLEEDVVRGQTMHSVLDQLRSEDPLRYRREEADIKSFLSKRFEAKRDEIQALIEESRAERYGRFMENYNANNPPSDLGGVNPNLPEPNPVQEPQPLTPPPPGNTPTVPNQPSDPVNIPGTGVPNPFQPL